MKNLIRQIQLVGQHNYLMRSTGRDEDCIPQTLTDSPPLHTIFILQSLANVVIQIETLSQGNISVSQLAVNCHLSLS